MRSTVDSVKVYEQDKLTFYLSPRRTVIRTSLQTFFLVPRQSYWHNRIRLIRTMIVLGEIRDLNELATFCGSAVEWRMTAVPIEHLVYNEVIR